jgi:hypothetical protein
MTSRELSRYFARIGRVGGRKSRRALDAQTARQMVKVREARRAFAKYQASCFWSYAPDYEIREQDVPWVAEMLKRHGDRRAWEIGEKLCR